MGKFIFNYGVGCRKKVTSQGCGMYKRSKMLILVLHGVLRWYRMVKHVSGDEAIWNYLDSGPKDLVSILKEKGTISFFCPDTLKRSAVVTWPVI